MPRLSGVWREDDKTHACPALEVDGRMQGVLMNFVSEIILLAKHRFRKPSWEVAICTCEHPKIVHRDYELRVNRCECQGWISDFRLMELKDA